MKKAKAKSKVLPAPVQAALTISLLPFGKEKPDAEKSSSGSVNQQPKFGATKPSREQHSIHAPAFHLFYFCLFPVA
ncbi:MAG: hypothetical protein HY231_02940 [Acidobacteria bacterium]|nr:hypothetical protein [Acidobacteriota bacterium]